MPTKEVALSRFRVLDLSRVRAGPTCARILADFGADVIRVEPPAGIDPNDGMFAERRTGGDFQNLNRNKRSLTLNLKTDEGMQILRELVAEADVVLENWRPDVKARLGLDFESLSRINPRIILASISGYGQTGPYAWWPGFDQVVQGMSGLMSITGFPEGPPTRVGIAVADSSAGVYAASGILVALLEREVSGKGQWVQTSLLHTMIAMMDFQVARYLVDGDVPAAAGNDHPTAAPMGMFRASDGYFNIGVSGYGQWKNFCTVMGKSDWAEHPDFINNDDRVANRARIHAMMEPILLTQPVKHWVEAFNRANVPAGPVYDVPQMLADEQVAHIGATQQVETFFGKDINILTLPVTLGRSSAELRKGAPDRGEHTDEILAALGRDAQTIAALRTSGVV
jgi:crotonobetainyl-CoA:carnitine CoA-transferase CaiB-like acyl-CoA transferase